jgi:serine-aspartate repeat-containing protein C/D/E
MGGVFRDMNGNSFIDPADVIIQGVTIRLFDSVGNFLSQTTTGSNGAFTFSNLAPGIYQVVEVDPANHVSVGAFPGPNGTVLNVNTFRVTVFAGVTSADNNFLDRLTQVSPTVGSISGFVVRDANLNGVIDLGEPGVSGATVQLFLGGGFIQQTTTGANGGYSFTNLPTGFYQVVEIVPAGYTAVNSFGGVNGTALTATNIAVSVVANVNSSGNNFLIRLVGPPPGGGPNTISGFAIRDLNTNGQADNEPGLAGMFITLQDGTGTTVGTVLTDSTGAFSFTGLANGTYTLFASPPLSLSSTNAIPGQNGIRLSANAIRVTTSFGLTQYQGQIFLAGP